MRTRGPCAISNEQAHCSDRREAPRAASRAPARDPRPLVEHSELSLWSSTMPNAFDAMLTAGYGFTEPAVTLGAALEQDGAVHQEPKVRIPLAMMNRHGLIAGATGTGKTKTLQLLTEQLSAQGVPVFVADVKGDLGGLAMPGDATDRVTGRANGIGWDWQAAGVPVEFVSLSGRLGVQLRATVSSFGPLLLGKALSLNETQTSVLTMVFRYCDDAGLPLLDLPDLKAVLQYLSSDEGKPALAQYGGMAGSTVGVLLRKMVELEAQGADEFFGEPEFDVKDLLRVTSDGRGVVTCLELADVQDRPLLWSTFMMCCWRSCTRTCPRRGTCRSPSSPSSSTRRTCCSTTHRRRFWTRCSRWCGSSARRAWACTS